MEDAFRRFQAAVVKTVLGSLELMRGVVNFMVKPSTFGWILIIIVVILIFNFGQFLFGLAIAYGLIWIGVRIGRVEA